MRQSLLGNCRVAGMLNFRYMWKMVKARPVVGRLPGDPRGNNDYATALRRRRSYSHNIRAFYGKGPGLLFKKFWF